MHFVEVQKIPGSTQRHYNPDRPHRLHNPNNKLFS